MAARYRGSFLGPDEYPIYYQATLTGTCRLENGDFWVKIVVLERPPPTWLAITSTP